MEAWVQTATFRQFFLQTDIADDIKRCHQAIDIFLESFNIHSQVAMHSWMAQHEQNRQRDHAEQIRYLSDIANQQALMQQTLVSSRADLAGLFGMIQEVSSSPSVCLKNFDVLRKSMGGLPVGDYHHTGLATNLWGMQRASGQLLPKLELKNGEVRKVHNYPTTGSAQFDIFEGVYLGHAKCAIKVVRGIEATDKIKTVQLALFSSIARISTLTII